MNVDKQDVLLGMMDLACPVQAGQQGLHNSCVCHVFTKTMRTQLGLNA
jgi:hypothetical protein